ncbi:c-type cytochrome [Aestuariicoccus sp. MJ-SS9]|uniref:c-type cytochrome n=1 Tax=Aestuariicoccus sp. MJ-SS9 TaxID=3079855 RepID=UPI00290ADD47|nr:cytochrome c [Aestuariicoccus sp. MJ-SS9]MDU8911960.1 cytochrome c [Aestuariicoccus sp. MJ-SS9]
MKPWVHVALFAALTAPLAIAHESATGVVKDRMEQMERFEELIERVFAMIHGELTYDAAAVRRAGEEIRAGSGRHMTALFPEGSNAPPSEATDTIWQEPASFQHYADMLEQWSGELAARADGRLRGTLPQKWEDAEMGPAMMQGGGMMGRSGPVFAAWHVAAACNACHAEFRKEE